MVIFKKHGNPQRYCILFLSSCLTFFGFTTLHSNPSEKLPVAAFRCCFEDQVMLSFPHAKSRSFSTVTLPLIPFTYVENISYKEIKTAGTKWKITALKVDSVGMLLAELSQESVQQKLLPFIAVVLDDTGAEYLLVAGNEGQISMSSVKYLTEHSLVEYQGKPSIEVGLPVEGNAKTSIPLYFKVF